MSQSAPDGRFDKQRAALVVVDVQERLAAAMPGDRLAMLGKGVTALVELARRFEMPVLVTEQYPKGLGPTIPQLNESVSQLGNGLHRFEKLEFSVCAAEPFDAIWNELSRPQWIVTGMESHVCVYQSVRDLRARGAQVFVPVDAVVSRTEENRHVGIDLMQRAGAIPTSTETLVFEALERAGGDDFKALSRLIR